MVDNNVLMLTGFEPLFFFVSFGLIINSNFLPSKGNFFLIQNKIKHDILFLALYLYMLKTIFYVFFATEISDFLKETSENKNEIFNSNVLSNKINLFICFLFFVKNILSKKFCLPNKIKNIEIPITFSIFLTASFFIKTYSFLYTFFCFLAINFFLYIIVFFNRDINVKHETTTKYFYLSTLSACLFGYATWISFDMFSNLSILQMECLLHKLFLFLHVNKSIILILTFTSISFFFKIAIFPCHFWTPEIYKNSNQNLVFFLSVPIKIVFCFVLFKIVKNVFLLAYNFYAPFFLFSSVISLILGAFGALYEKTLKSFFAYTSINQIGFLILTLIFANFSSINSFMYFFVLYSINCILFFYVIEKIGFYTKKKQIFFIDQLFYTFGKTQDSHIICFVMFSFAGIPILGGFYAKYLIFCDVFQNKEIIILIIILSTNLLSSFYYVSVIKKTMFEKKKIRSFFKTKSELLFSILSSTLILWTFFHSPVFYFFEKENEKLFL